MMTDAQRQKAMTVLSPRLTSKKCAVCASRNWLIADIVNYLPYDPNGGVLIGGQAIPVLIVVCQQCAYILHFAAVPLGLVL